MSSNLAILQISGRNATLSLNRPEARNALSIDLLTALDARLDEIEAHAAELSTLVITGEGKAFCAGMDLKAVLEDDALALELLTRLAMLTLRLRKLPMVTIARVNGAAIGGGCGLACVCDFALTHESAKLGFPEVDLGVCPAVVAPWLVRKIGAGPARAVLLAGGLMSGLQAKEVGIVSLAAGSLEALDTSVQDLVKRITGGGPVAIAATKRLLNEIDGSLDEPLLRRAAEISARVLATPDAKARLQARLSAN
jgi:methylglutaconyl-CoA hydratase